MNSYIDPPIWFKTQKHLLALIQIKKEKKKIYTSFTELTNSITACAAASAFFSQFIFLTERNYKNNLHRVKSS